MQYERLRAEAAVNVPAVRFALLRSGRLVSKTGSLQERVEGTTLGNVRFLGAEVTKRWWAYLPAISAELSGLLDSNL